MLATLLFSLCLLTFFGGCLLVRKLDPGWKRFYNPLVLLGGSTALYTITPWYSAPSWDSPVLESFLLMQLIAFCGMISGAVCAHIYFPALYSPGYLFTARPRHGEGLILFAQVFILLLFIVVYDVYLGGIGNIFLSGYKNIAGVESTSDPFEFFLLVFVQFGLPAVLVSAYLSGVNRTIFWICASVYLLLLLASGTRNFLVMFVGNFVLLTSVVKARLSYLKFSGIAIGLLFFMTVIGLYRNFGFEGRSEMLQLYGSEGLKTLDPSSQELSTSYGVFQIHSAHPTWFPLVVGESYFNAILSIVPTALWPGRPDAVSKIFSSYFALPGEGVGFSNILEAYLNGGLVGVFIVNALFLFVLVAFYNKSIVGRVTVFGLAFYGNIVFIAFNWNRIDFQTVFKISMIRIALFYALASLLVSIVESDTGRGVRRVAHRDKFSLWRR